MHILDKSCSDLMHFLKKLVPVLKKENRNIFWSIMYTNLQENTLSGCPGYLY